jgi:ribulose-bisphosphate carboxylase large chain
MAHPDGPAAGVRSLRKWWEAAVEGLTNEQAAAKYPELRKSLDKFRKTKREIEQRLCYKQATH